MKFLAELFKINFDDNDYDIDATITAINCDAYYVKSDWEDSNGNIQSSIDVIFSDGSIANVHQYGVEIMVDYGK